MDYYTLNDKLVAAIQNHDIDLVESLISQGADVNYATSMEGFTPLIFSILLFLPLFVLKNSEVKTPVKLLHP